MVTLADPSQLGLLYKYLAEPLPQAERRILNRRLREFGMKVAIEVKPL